MSMRKLSFMVLAVCLLIVGCKKDDDNGSADNVSEYVKFTPGNYWIYESYVVDSLGSATLGGLFGGPPVYDSMYVEKDTIINSRTYHKLVNPGAFGGSNYEITFLRDSLNYEVDHLGMIVLAPTDFTSIFRSITRGETQASSDSATNLTVRMADRNKSLTTPAGTFTTISMDNVWTFYPYAAQQRAVSERRQHFRFANGIGMISATEPFYAILPSYQERRLIRYSVK